jgi:hypothetical protein
VPNNCMTSYDLHGGAAHISKGSYPRCPMCAVITSILALPVAYGHMGHQFSRGSGIQITGYTNYVAVEVQARQRE